MTAFLYNCFIACFMALPDFPNGVCNKAKVNCPQIEGITVITNFTLDQHNYTEPCTNAGSYGKT